MPAASAVIPCRNPTPVPRQGQLLPASNPREREAETRAWLIPLSGAQEKAKVRFSTGECYDRSQGHVRDSWKAQAKTELQLLKKE